MRSAASARVLGASDQGRWACKLLRVAVPHRRGARGCTPRHTARTLARCGRTNVNASLLQDNGTRRRGGARLNATACHQCHSASMAGDGTGTTATTATTWTGHHRYSPAAYAVPCSDARTTPHRLHNPSSQSARATTRECCSWRCSRAPCCRCSWRRTETRRSSCTCRGKAYGRLI